MSTFCPIIDLLTGECTGEMGGIARAVHLSGLIVFFRGSLNSRPQAIPGQSDADYVAQQLAAHGTGYVTELNGAFFLAVYNTHSRKLRLYRDQLGQHLAYYATLNKGTKVFFSDRLSDIRQTLAANGIQCTVYGAALGEYFMLGYTSCTGTIYNEIFLVPAAHEILILSSNKISQSRYWYPHFNGGEKLTREEAIEGCTSLLRQSIARCLAREPNADFMLSGGIDSGVVAGLVSEFFPDEQRLAHTIELPGSPYDESELAEGTAKRCHLNLHKQRLTAADIDLLEKLIVAADSPFADSSLLPTYLACTASDKPALFTGDGGDELFGGYRRYQAMILRGALPQWLDCLCRPFAKLFASILPDGCNSRSKMATLKRSLNVMSKPYLEAYASFQAITNKALLEKLLPRTELASQLETWKLVEEYMNYWQHNVNSLFRKCNALDLTFYLPDDGFRKTAIAGGVANKTLLCPLLDLDVANFALCLPDHLRITPRHNKILLRAIGEKYLDPQILTMRKRGFGIPIAQWFRQDLAKRITDIINTTNEWDVLNLFEPNLLKLIAKQHISGYADHAALLWAVWCYYIWITHNKELRISSEITTQDITV